MIWISSIITFIVGISAGIWATLEKNDDHVTQVSARLAHMENCYRNLINKVIELEQNNSVN